MFTCLRRIPISISLRSPRSSTTYRNLQTLTRPPRIASLGPSRAQPSPSTRQRIEPRISSSTLRGLCSFLNAGSRGTEWSRSGGSSRSIHTTPPHREAMKGPAGVRFDPKRPFDTSQWSAETYIFVGVTLGGLAYYVVHLEKVPETGRWRFMNISPQAEQKLAIEAREQLLEQYGDKILPPNHPITLHVRSIVERILTAGDLGVLVGPGDTTMSPRPPASSIPTPLPGPLNARLGPRQAPSAGAGAGAQPGSGGDVWSTDTDPYDTSASSGQDQWSHSGNDARPASESSTAEGIWDPDTGHGGGYPSSGSSSGSGSGPSAEGRGKGRRMGAGVRRVARVETGRQREWTLLVVDDPRVVNAAAAYGNVIVFTGILPVAETETGLASIISHEIGHVVARHSTERASSQTVLLFLSGLLSQVVGIDFGLSSIVTNLLYALPMSRTQELEADSIGLRLSAKACYEPQETPNMMKRLGEYQKATSGGSGSRLFAFLETHPQSEERVKNLESKVPDALQLQADGSCMGIQEALQQFGQVRYRVKAS